MKIRDIKNFLLGTFRGRLIFGVAMVYAVVMTLFIADLTLRQRAMLLERQGEEASALALSLATSSAVWIASDDLVGLQELVDSQRRYPELMFAILTDDRGLILAHTDKSRIGQYLLDLPGEAVHTVMSKIPVLVDVAAPSILGNRHVGWARIGISQSGARKKLALIIIQGVLYTVMAIVIGSFIAWKAGSRMTRRLYAVQETINKVRNGDQAARSIIPGGDEAASIAAEVNAMLDALDERSSLLVRSEMKYRMLLRNIRSGVVVHGPDTRVMMSNPMAHDLLGLSEEQMLGKAAIDPAWRFLREDGSAMPLEEYPVNRVLATHRPLRDLIVGVRSPDRETVTWVLVNSELTLSGQGEIDEIIVTFVDITERKTTEEALRQSEGLYASFVAASPDGEAVIDLQGTVIFGSKRIYELLQISHEEDIRGLNALEWMIPADRERAARDISRIAAGSVLLDEQYTIVRKDGSTLPVEISGAPIPGHEGKLDGIVTILRDASSRRESESALRMSRETLNKRENDLNEAQRLAQIGSWDWDAVHDTIWWSNEYYRLYSFDPKKSPPNYSEHLKAYTPASIELLDAAVKHSMETGAPYEVDLELADPTASTKWIIARGEVKRDADGKIWGLRGTAQNITERKNAEEEIKQLNKDLEQRVAGRTEDLEKKSGELKLNQLALMNIVEDLNEKTADLEHANMKLQELDRLKSMFIASMSHELRTPLNSIIGFSSIMLNEWTGPLTAEQKENLAAVLRSGKHLLSLINDVIDVSKIEAGKIESAAEEFDVHDAVMETVETLKRDIDKKGLVLSVSVPRQVMHADRRRLLQCLLNLVSNAVKYTERGSIVITAEITEDGLMIALSVEDTGIGIREDDLDKLFTPFVRLHAPMGITVPGTGLGLYLSRKLAREILKGDILSSSDFGRGSRFTLKVPLAAEVRS